MTDPTKPEDSGEQVWERGWEEHERLQLQRLAKLSLPQKLARLEEAHRLVRHMASQKDQAKKPPLELFNP